MEELLSNRDYDGVASFCELEELQSEGGVSPNVYTVLLAVYLLQNELDHAKLLWQRIPEEMKQLHEVLGQLWAIGKELWRKDFPAVYKLARTGAWPDLVAPLVESLVVKVQERALTLVSKAYRTIRVGDLSDLLGLTEAEVKQVATSKGWTFESSSNTYQPVPLPPEAVVTEDKEERLRKLTDIISFLEN